MPDTWIDTRGRKRCWSCGMSWSARHPQLCKASCDDGEQYPTVKAGKQTNVYGYPIENKKDQGVSNEKA